MPELPEVETITRSLQRHLQGAVVTDAKVFDKLRDCPAEAELAAFCSGRTIKAISRRAKYIRVRFDNDTGLILHLGMTGAFSVTPNDNQPQRHERVAWSLQDGRRWRFFDIRKFGRVLLCHENPELDTHPVLRELGPEPFDDSLTPEYLQEKLAGRRSPVKPALLEQGLLVGVGNIYDCEALFAAGIDPRTPACEVSLAQWKLLLKEIRAILRRAIAAGGTHISDFRDVDGSEGKFVQQLQVYGRAGEACPRCGTPIERLTQGGRSTFFCPQCQHFSCKK